MRLLTYQAAYHDAGDGWLAGQVLDFPGAVSQGHGLDETRKMLATALVDLSESLIRNGSPLPIPDPSLTDDDADLVEPIHLLLDASAFVRVVPEERIGA